MQTLLPEYISSTKSINFQSKYSIKEAITKREQEILNEISKFNKNDNINEDINQKDDTNTVFMQNLIDMLNRYKYLIVGVSMLLIFTAIFTYLLRILRAEKPKSNKKLKKQ